MQRPSRDTAKTPKIFPIVPKQNREVRGLDSNLSSKMKTKAVVTENERSSRSGRHQVNRDLPHSIPSEVAKFVTKGLPSPTKNKRSSLSKSKAESLDSKKSVTIPASGNFPEFDVKDKSLLSSSQSNYIMKSCTVPVRTCDTEQMMDTLLENIKPGVLDESTEKEKAEPIFEQPNAKFTRRTRKSAKNPNTLIKSAPGTIESKTIDPIAQESIGTNQQSVKDEQVNSPTRSQVPIDDVVKTKDIKEPFEIILNPVFVGSMENPTKVSTETDPEQFTLQNDPMPKDINSSSFERQVMQEDDTIKKNAINLDEMKDNIEIMTIESQMEMIKDKMEYCQPELDSKNIIATPTATAIESDFEALNDSNQIESLELSSSSLVIKKEFLDDSCERISDENLTNGNKWYEGQLIWCAYGGGFWPSIVVKGRNGELEHINKKGNPFVLVKYLNDTRFGECNIKTAVPYCTLEELYKLFKKKLRMTVGYKKAVHAAEFFMKVPAIDRVNLYDAIVTRNKNRQNRTSSDSGIISGNDDEPQKAFQSGTSIETLLVEYYKSMAIYEKSVSSDMIKAVKNKFTLIDKQVKQVFTAVSQSSRPRRQLISDNIEDDASSIYSGLSNYNDINDDTAVKIKVEKDDTLPIQKSKRVRKPTTKHIVGLEDRAEEPPPSKRQKIKKKEESLEELYICKHAESLKIFEGIPKTKVCVYCFCQGELILCQQRCGKLLHKECFGVGENQPLICKECLINKNKCFLCEEKSAIVLKYLEQENNDKEMERKKYKSEPADEKATAVIIIEPKEEVDNMDPVFKSSDLMETECSSDLNMSTCTDLQKSTKVRENLTISPESLICTRKRCGLIYHSQCLKNWPQAKHIDKFSAFVCPAHDCHTCAARDDEKKEGTLMNCTHCPAVYHYNLACIPAASELLSTTQLICPRHLNLKQKPSKKAKKGLPSDAHININWCSYCLQGGQLICCEGCPKAFHQECLMKDLPESTLTHEEFLCFACQKGQMPCFNDIVWAKIGAFRWWPCQVMPSEVVAERMLTLQTNRQQFCVRFFGTHDYAWKIYYQVFQYDSMEAGGAVSSKSVLEAAFKTALSEAKAVYDLLQLDTSENSKDKPPRFQKIKVNTVVPPLKMIKAKAELTACECSPDNPCTDTSDCWNRTTFTECSDDNCSNNEMCQNRRLQRRLYAETKIIKTVGRGWGLVAMADIEMDDLVIEYVGELIDNQEKRRRVVEKEKNNSKKYYFMHVMSGVTIDAEHKANNARFMNHSCSPNCQPLKWTVDGLNRIGLMALRNIKKGEELTFDYSWENDMGGENAECLCKAANCRKFMGLKAVKELKQPKMVEIPKKRFRKSSKKMAAIVVKHVTGESSSEVDEEMLVDQ